MAVVEHKEIWLRATEIAPERVAALLAAGREPEARQLVSAFTEGLRRCDAPAAWPLHVALGEQNTGFTAMDGPAAAWSPMADYPEPIARNALGAYEGKVYSVGGVPANGVLPISRGYVYDPATAAWSPIAPLPQAVASPTGAFLDGTFYVVGGTTAKVAELSTVYAYHPVTDSWSRVADLPESVFASTVSVLDGKLYVVGGCLGNCGQSATAATYRFDPALGSWTRVADYPIKVSQMACAGVSGEIVCNGGTSPDAGNDYLTLASTYIYHPATDSWTQGADSPYGAWGMAYSGADGKLQIAGGLVKNADSALASQYDPVTNAWSALPSAPTAFYGSGSGGCGLYQVGSAGPPRSFASVLPGYDQCGGDDVSWLSEGTTGVDLAAGQSVTVAVTVDASKVAQPGGYTAALTVTTDSPYSTPPVAAALHVTAPKAWGKISGTVTDAATGAPIAGATVQICTMYRAGMCGQVSYTLKTDSHGGYGQWLDKGYNPLFLTVAINGYQPKFQQARITGGRQPGGRLRTAGHLTRAQAAACHRDPVAGGRATPGRRTRSRGISPLSGSRRKTAPPGH